MNKEKFKVKIEKIVDDYSNCSLIDVDAISEEAYELALTLTDVVKSDSEQLVCDDKCEWTRYPKNGAWYDGCIKCGKEVAN